MSRVARRRAYAIAAAWLIVKGQSAALQRLRAVN